MQDLVGRGRGFSSALTAREPPVGFQLGKTGPDVFPLSYTHFIHSFVPLILIEQTHEKVLSMISHQGNANKTQAMITYWSD